MKLKHLLFSCGLAILQLSSPVQSHAAPPVESEAVMAEKAPGLYQTREWSRAYGNFLRLAGSGHQESARIALFMLQHGPQIYGTTWSAPQTQIAHWMKVSSVVLHAIRHIKPRLFVHGGVVNPRNSGTIAVVYALP